MYFSIKVTVDFTTNQLQKHWIFTTEMRWDYKKVILFRNRHFYLTAKAENLNTKKHIKISGSYSS